jgi:hypothetical protein
MANKKIILHAEASTITPQVLEFIETYEQSTKAAAASLKLF